MNPQAWPMSAPFNGLNTIEEWSEEMAAPMLPITGTPLDFRYGSAPSSSPKVYSLKIATACSCSTHFCAMDCALAAAPPSSAMIIFTGCPARPPLELIQDAQAALATGAGPETAPSTPEALPNEQSVIGSRGPVGNGRSALPFGAAAAT